MAIPIIGTRRPERLIQPVILGGGINVCESLSIGDHSDWRLPERVELLLILDSGRYHPVVNPIYFPWTHSFYYWSSTALATSSAKAVVLSLVEGIVLGKQKTSKNSVHCVRGRQPKVVAKSFTDNGNGTIADNETGLLWQQGEGGLMDWESALTYCENLSLAGSNWRLPNRNEVASMMDDSEFNPALDTAYFPGVHSSDYWSSTSYPNFNPPNAWIVDPVRGLVGTNIKATGHYVRCVRGGQ